MQDTTATLLVGLGGILATLTASGMGLYFVSKARSSALRESLFQRQIDLIAKVTRKKERFRVFLTLLHGENSNWVESAREDIGICVKEFSELEEEGSALLPVELWTEIKQLSSHMIKILVAFDEGKGVTDEHIKDFVARSLKVGLISRVVVGVDELTEESIQIFSSKEAYENLAAMELDHFRQMCDQRDKGADE